MKKAIKLLSLVNKHNFLNLYFVISKPSNNVFAIESIGFLTYEEAQKMCDYKNERDNTRKYSVFRTCTLVE